ncbi:hypothetical protein PLEOSDRAFT_1086445 [Pleurotus ostreatus PC15]|uniref:Uncharacterized protein n=1 Tax=Pleurotus ostreatus (strain PC15) TaxID=1137138 RepID=A0A067N8H1_PLEO1|nr:hypothetical protein PLEOSDRAFT_1086445 [Pleurotus ostreatus PC15]
MRCTFVKFHRQTAPIGPGHNPILSSSGLSGYSAPTDLLLDPAVLSTAPTFGDPTSSLMYKSPFPLSTSYLPNDIPQPDLAKPSEADFAKYQSQAEYIRRLSLFQPSTEAAPPTSTTTLGWGSETSAPSGLGTCHRSNISTISRDEELRALKDSWKMYLRTPLSGPEEPMFTDFSTPASTGYSYHRTRVSSMPSVQTPSAERSGPFAANAITASCGPLVSVADGATASVRPSFKRLASRTLGAENAKRTMFAYDASDDESDAVDGKFDRRDVSYRWNPEQQQPSQPGFQPGFPQAAMPPPSSFGGLAGRRRMSAPAMRPTVLISQLLDS